MDSIAVPLPSSKHATLLPNLPFKANEMAPALQPTSARHRLTGTRVDGN
jgi:hypothetical protein